MERKEIKNLEYFRLNAEENYSTTPISVLKYISELEKLKAPEMLEMLNKIHGLLSSKVMPTETDCKVYSSAIEQLIKQATTI